jgi:hypothetical protein
MVEFSDTNISPTSIDDSETCSLHESVGETVVAAVSNKSASVEMRENADAEDSMCT